jgi:hypothetical protein
MTSRIHSLQIRIPALFVFERYPPAEPEDTYGVCLKRAGAPVPLFRRRKSPPLRAITLDDSEHLLHNHLASVASLRQLFTFTTERRSESHRNQRSPHRNIPRRRCRTIGPERFDLAKPDSQDWRFGYASMTLRENKTKVVPLVIPREKALEHSQTGDENARRTPSSFLASQSSTSMRSSILGRNTSADLMLR